jgi:oligopeptide transport system substrate-binding protein
VAAFACSGEEDDAGTSPPADNQLRLSLPGPPTSVDPHVAAAGLAEDFALAKQLFRGLFAYDEDLNLVADIASQLPTRQNGGISQDGLVYTIKLRNDVEWSDGRPLSAADFEYGLKRLLDPVTEAEAAGTFYDITGAEKFNSCSECTEGELAQLRQDVGITAVDNLTLRIRLNSPRATLPYLLAGLAASPLRQDLIEEHAENWTVPANLVTAGPFLLDDLSETEAVLLKNPRWWGKPVKLDRVTIRFVEDPADAFSMYLAGELDAVEVSADLKPTVDADPKLLKQMVQLPVLNSTAYFLNAAQPPFDDARVRQAFALAVDREAFFAVQAGTSRVAYSWLPSSMPGYDKERGREWRFNPEKARRLLAEAGYPNGSGLPAIAYAYTDSFSNAKPAAEFLRQQLQTNLGVTIVLEQLERDAWLDRLFGGELQVAYVGYTAEHAHPEEFLRGPWTCLRYESDECTSFDSGNLFSYANPEFDRLVSLAAKEPDAKRRLRLYGQAEDVLVDDAPAIFMTQGVRQLLVKPYVRGAVNTPLDVMPLEFFLDRAYIKD